MARGKFISYLRVSTDKQGRSGLGVEAQRTAVDSYLNGGRWTLVTEYVETESGRRSDRPQLAKALAHAKAIGATVVFRRPTAVPCSERCGPSVLRSAARPSWGYGPLSAHSDGLGG
jgi:Resolvase, N terminal domain